MISEQLALPPEPLVIIEIVMLLPVLRDPDIVSFVGASESRGPNGEQILDLRRIWSLLGGLVTWLFIQLPSLLTFNR